MTFLDRIKETSTSTGTGTFTLGGAVLGYKVFTNGTYKYCIVNETESEWEVGEGTVTSGVLTRTTIEASSNGGAAVSFSAGTKYVFNTVSAAYVNSLVPYTGATSAVNLGAYGLTSDYLQLSTTPTATSAVGRMIWNDTDGTMDIGLKGGNVILQVGQEQVVRVVNKVGATLLEANYQAVYISGAQGQRPKVALALGNADATSAATIGLVTETIADNQEGFITTSGIVRGINTTGSLQGETWADGDIVYLSPTTAGRITNVKPTAPNHTVIIGYVVYAHSTQGKIFVKVDNGYEIGELHDVYAPSPATGNGLFWNATNSRYELNTIAGVLGYTPANDSLVVHLAGAENITGVKTFQNALQTTTGNNLLNTGGGNTVIGYTADPASSTSYKLDVNGKTKTATLLVNDGTAYSIEYNAGTTNGKLLSKGSYPSFTLQTAAGQNRVDISNGGPNATIQMWYGTQSGIYLDTNADGYYALGFAYGKTSAPVASAILELSSVSRGLLLPRMTTAQKTAISTPATSLLVYDTDLASFQYYTGSAWAGLGGATGSGAAGQITYWSGTSAVTGSSNMVWDATNSRLSIAAGASPAYRLQVHGSMRVGTTAASAMYWDDTNNRLGIGTSSPSTSLHVIGSVIQIATITSSSSSGTRLAINNTSVSPNTGVALHTNGVSNWSLASYVPSGTNASFVFYNDRTNTDSFFINGDTNNVGIRTTTPTARLDIPASVTSAASLRIRSGTAPTSPNDGDIWYDGTNIYIRVGTTTKTFTII